MMQNGRIRVLQHLREIGVGNPLEKLVLGSAWRWHDALDLKQEQLEMKTEGICVIRWSKPSGVYIMNFYRPKYIMCKKTESGRRTRSPRDRGVRPVRVDAPSTLMEASCPSRTTYFFLKFLNIPKLIKIAIRVVLESVYLPYHVPMPWKTDDKPTSSTTPTSPPPRK